MSFSFCFCVFFVCFLFLPIIFLFLEPFQVGSLPLLTVLCCLLSVLLSFNLLAALPLCSGSLLTRPNGSRPNQGLPPLLPREERPLVSLLPSFLPAFLAILTCFAFFFVSSSPSIHPDILSLSLSLLFSFFFHFFSAHVSVLEIFYPQIFFFQIQEQKI